MPRWPTCMAALVDERVRPPRQGDSDEGRVVLLDAPEHNRWPALLVARRRALRPARLVAGGGAGRRQRARRRPARREARRSTAGRRTRPSRFADAGITILRTDAADSPGDMVSLRRRAARVPVHRRARARRRAVRGGPLRRAWTSSPTPAPTATTASRSGGPTSARRSGTTPSRSAGATSPAEGGPFMWLRQARTWRSPSPTRTRTGPRSTTAMPRCAPGQAPPVGPAGPRRPRHRDHRRDRRRRA